MKANELRIGNYIEFDSSVRTLVIEDEQGFIEVRSIGESGVNEWSDYGASGCVSNPKPVPLTEDWLIKFGFKKKKQPGRLYDYYYYLNGFYYSFIDFHNIVYKNKSLEGVELKHVHQLQNLYFALTGEELKIKY